MNTTHPTRFTAYDKIPAGWHRHPNGGGKVGGKASVRGVKVITSGNHFSRTGRKARMAIGEVWEIGDRVRATSSTQGMTRGQVYTITNKNVTRGFRGDYSSYQLDHKFWIVNASLVVETVSRQHSRTGRGVERWDTGGGRRPTFGYVGFAPFHEEAYRSANGTKPDGVGMWKFVAPDGSIVTVPRPMSYADAKAWIIKNAPMSGQYKVALSRTGRKAVMAKDGGTPWGSWSVADAGWYWEEQIASKSNARRALMVGDLAYNYGKGMTLRNAVRVALKKMSERGLVTPNEIFWLTNGMVDPGSHSRTGCKAMMNGMR